MLFLGSHTFCCVFVVVLNDNYGKMHLGDGFLSYICFWFVLELWKAA